MAMYGAAASSASAGSTDLLDMFSSDYPSDASRQQQSQTAPASMGVQQPMMGTQQPMMGMQQPMMGMQQSTGIGMGSPNSFGPMSPSQQLAAAEERRKNQASKQAATNSSSVANLLTDFRM